jgi:hypothetical protein
LLARRAALKERYGDEEMDMLGSYQSEPELYSNRLTPVTKFLECLFAKEWIIDSMKRTSESVWRRLESSFINFNHFTEDIKHEDAYNCRSEEGLLSLFIRGCALQCAHNQEGIDLLIPMAVLPGEDFDRAVSKSDISAIIIQVKNRREDTHSFTTKFISDSKFGMSHITGFSSSEEKPYVGLWMSFGTMNDDVSIEGHTPTTATCNLPYSILYSLGLIV